MRRVAASRVYLSEKEFRTNHVVELFNHAVTNLYPLHEELPFTEWLGGAIVVTPAAIPPESLRAIRSLGDFYAYEFHIQEQAPPELHSGNDAQRMFAYHITPFDLTSERITPHSTIARL